MYIGKSIELCCILGIWVSVRLLDGDIKQVKEAYPHLIVGPTIVARKMGFPEVIMPCKYIYIPFMWPLITAM